MMDDKQNDKTAETDVTARPPCLSCQGSVHRSRERGARFCQTCLDRSQMKNLNALYDDIGGPG